MHPQKHQQNGKAFNHMHSSHIFSKTQHNITPEKSQEQSRLSQWFTRASSEVGHSDCHQYGSIVENYESKIRHLQTGYERSKEQFESTLKLMYKQKIILLNIISHNQELVDEFRSKIKLGPQSHFKEIQNKYNIITSGLYHNQLCPQCILSISNLETQMQRSRSKQHSKKEESRKSIQKVVQLRLQKQYSWMYVPGEDLQMAILKLRSQNQKLKNSVQQLLQEHGRRLSDKNKEIQALKGQLSKISKVVIPLPPKQIGTEIREKALHRELIRQNQLKSDQLHKNKETYQAIIHDLNERITELSLQQLNCKYKFKYY